MYIMYVCYVILKPKGASVICARACTNTHTHTQTWKVVRPPLESAADVLERERLLVCRTLEVVCVCVCVCVEARTPPRQPHS